LEKEDEDFIIIDVYLLTMVKELNSYKIQVQVPSQMISISEGVRFYFVVWLTNKY
jgi:hypothetical protein